MSVKSIPDGHHTLTPYLLIRDAARALDFYQRAFNAVVACRLDGPTGKVMHAQIRIGDSMLMLADECPEMGGHSPQALGGSPVVLHLYIEDCDALFAQAISAGATSRFPVQDQFYGDRSGTLLDPFGHLWTLSTHKEDLTIEQIKARAAQYRPPAAAH